MNPDDLEFYRGMTPGERLQLALELSDLAWSWLDVPDRETGDRKWAAWNRAHDESNDSLVSALRRHAREQGSVGQ